MKHLFVKILLIILGLVSAMAILLTAQVIYFAYIQDFYFIFESLGIFISIVGYIIIERLEKEKPKEKVKIVYKTIDRTSETKTENEKKQDDQKVINQIVTSCLKDLDKYTDSLEDFGDQLFKNLSQTFNIVTGMLFLWDKTKQVYYTADTFAFYSEQTYKEYKLGEGLIGQVAKDKKILYIDNVPEGYIEILSGLGKGSPHYLTLLPLVKDNITVAVVEFASFSPIPEPTEKILETLSKKLSELTLTFEELS